MKRQGLIVIGLLLSGLIGWFLGYLRLPFLPNNYAFGLGFLACLAVGALVWVLLFLWNKNVRLFQALDQSPNTAETKSSYRLLWLAVAGIIILGSLASSLMIYRQNAFYQSKLQAQDENIKQQLAYSQATRSTNAIVLTSSLLKSLEAELAQDPNRRLSQVMIDRVATLSYAFEPDHRWEDGQIPEEKYSKERGLLLLMLSKIDIDSTSFAQLKAQTSFIGADLRKADLKAADLSGVDLSYANLQDADLTGAVLNGARLAESNLNGATLQDVSAENVFLQNANLTWTACNGANWRKSDFNGAILNSGQFRKANFDSTNLYFAHLKGAFLNEATLADADLTGAQFERTNLTKADLTRTKMKIANFSAAVMKEADLTDATLDRVGVDIPNWFEQLKVWNVIGVDTIQAVQEVREDFAKEYKYRVMKKDS
ncbi:MAG: pentapeptide repeat-containing protein [Bacteroidota bacterium]